MLLLNKQATEHGWDSYLSHVATPLLLQAGALDLGQTARLQRRFRAHSWGPGRTKGETSTPNACFHRIPTFQPILARRVVMRTDTCLPADFYFSTQTYPISLLLANDDMLRLAIHRKTSVVVVRNKCDRYFSQGVLPRAPHFLMSTAQSAQKGQPNELHP
jgi:hypothetical protein